MKQKIILDTDMGSDIDDAITLTYLLCHPDCELLGVTTMTGSVVQRAMVADSIIRHMGQNVPVYPGVADPILMNQRQPDCRQAAQLIKWPHATEFRMNYAIEFIREMVEQYPGEITLVGVGPSTNIGLLLAAYPHVAQGLKEIVQMIGYFTFTSPRVRGYTEWNCFCDPHAAQICFQAPLHRHRLFGLDVTMQLVLPEKDAHELFTARALQPVMDYCEPWFRRPGRPRIGIIFHDPLAAACVFEESICSYLKGDVTVDLKGEAFFGATKFEEKPEGVREIAVTVDTDRFFQHFFQIVNAAG